LSALAFWLLAPLLVGGALGVVLSRNLYHSAYCLAAVLVTTALFYLALTAPLVAAVQILLYTGGVLTLVVFAIVVVGGEVVGPATRKPWAAVVASIATFAVLARGVSRIDFGPPVGGLDAGAELGVSLFVRDYMVPFELLSVLLLAAVVGALVLARKDPSA